MRDTENTNIDIEYIEEPYDPAEDEAPAGNLTSDSEAGDCAGEDGN